MTPPPDFERARTPDQKAERLDSILEAARSLLLETGDPWTLSLNGVARRAEMAKSNVYRYFPSLETILLGLLGAEWEAFTRAVEAGLKPGSRGAVDIPGTLAREMAARPLLGQLQAALPTLMERNVPPEIIGDFKMEGVRLMSRMAARMAEVDPRLPVEGYRELIRLVLPVMTGLWPIAHPKVEATHTLPPEMAVVLHFDFEEDLRRSVALLMAGLVKEARRDD